MSMTPENFIKPFPYLNEIHGLEKKVDNIIGYLDMSNILCIDGDFDDVSIPPTPNTKVQVKEIAGPKASYIKEVAKDWLKGLRNSCSEYLKRDTTFDDILEGLEVCLSKCIAGSKQYDMTNTLRFKSNIRFYIQTDNTVQPYPTSCIQFDENLITEWSDQLHLRHIFYQEACEIFENALNEHTSSLSSSEEAPATWASDLAELEIAELIQLLILSGKVKPNVSHSNFYKQFYAFFGMSDKKHHAKLQQINQRTNGHSILEDLISAQKSHRNAK